MVFVLDMLRVVCDCGGSKCRLWNVILQVVVCVMGLIVVIVVFFQAEDGIRDLVRSRGLGDVYKRQDRDIDLARGALDVHAADRRLGELLAQELAHLVVLSLIHI